MSDPNGLLDPGQSSKAAVDKWRAQMMAEFTPAERMQIRIRLGLPVTPSTPSQQGAEQ